MPASYLNPDNIGRPGMNGIMVYKLVQFFCYLCGVGFLLASMAKRSTLNMTDVESLQSLLLIFCVTLLFICLGSLSRQAAFENRPS